MSPFLEKLFCISWVWSGTIKDSAPMGSSRKLGSTLPSCVRYFFSVPNTGQKRWNCWFLEAFGNFCMKKAPKNRGVLDPQTRTLKKRTKYFQSKAKIDGKLSKIPVRSVLFSLSNQHMTMLICTKIWYWKCGSQFLGEDHDLPYVRYFSSFKIVDEIHVVSGWHPPVAAKHFVLVVSFAHNDFGVLTICWENFTCNVLTYQYLGMSKIWLAKFCLINLLHECTTRPFDFVVYTSP